ncbi:MAG: hypothetical protein DHS20C02_17770 [Micavibrio sp.]|nr:MAG: hypothetical protein DHS20C02_17770 [Micavibrio sp.]
MTDEQKENRILKGIATAFNEVAGALKIIFKHPVTPQLIGTGLMFVGMYYFEGDRLDGFIFGGMLGLSTSAYTLNSYSNAYRERIVKPLREERDRLEAELEDLISANVFSPDRKTNSPIQICSRYADVPKVEPANP